jgi:hypothetical protein
LIEEKNGLPLDQSLEMDDNNKQDTSSSHPHALPLPSNSTPTNVSPTKSHCSTDNEKSIII